MFLVRFWFIKELKWEAIGLDLKNTRTCAILLFTWQCQHLFGFHHHSSQHFLTCCLKISQLSEVDPSSWQMTQTLLRLVKYSVSFLFAPIIIWILVVLNCFSSAEIIYFYCYFLGSLYIYWVLLIVILLPLCFDIVIGVAHIYCCSVGGWGSAETRWAGIGPKQINWEAQDFI